MSAIARLIGLVHMEFLTVEEAAERLSVSVATVRRWAAAGRIAAQKSGKQWLIEGDKLPKRLPRRRLGRPVAHPAMNLPLALRHVQATDLNEVWVPDILRFEDYLQHPDEILEIAAAHLQHDAYDSAVEVDVAKTPFFTRSATLLSLEDRIAYQAAVASFAEAAEAARQPGVFSARLSEDKRWFLQKGTDLWASWMKQVRNEVESGMEWMIKTDITAYYDHIPHQLLMEEISSLNVDHRTVTALRRMLHHWSIVPGLGIPQGPNASRVLGNLYLTPVDRAMVAGGCTYYRYMDDVRILGKTKEQVVAGLRLFEKECRRRGLIVSPAKTELLHGEEAARDGTEADHDRAQYFFGANNLPRARQELKKILKSSLGRDGHLSVRGARFSLWRLARLREYASLSTVLDRLEDLAPVASVVAAYLKHFITRRTVVRKLDAFLSDSTRSHSSFLVTWLFAAMLEHPGRLPASWTRHAARYVKDKNHPQYLRAIAASVFARSGLAADVAWIKREISREYDPSMLRAYAVALRWASALDKATARTLEARSPKLAWTVDYLQGRGNLPSLIYRDSTLKIDSLKP